MIGYVDAADAETKNGNVLLTLTSGDEKAPFFVTRHAARLLACRLNLALNELIEAEQGFEPTPFTKRQRRKQA